MAKLHVREAETAQVLRRLRDEDVMQVCVSVLVGPELSGLLGRKVRERAMTEEEQRRVRQEWRGGLPRLHEIPLARGGDLVAEAERVANRHPIGGADAVHIATALSLQRTLRGQTVQFLTADMKQAGAAEQEGLEVIRCHGRG